MPTAAALCRVYPRVCGGTRSPGAPTAAWCGLSPRVRGNRLPFLPGDPDPGSIPACAGEPFLIITYSSNRKVYPRVCGGTHAGYMRTFNTIGLSPRVRGNHNARQQRLDQGGSIPACAGEPVLASMVTAVSPVYPRVCGGTRRPRRRLRWREGLSPRVRGNPAGWTTAATITGSIPACAGEPRHQVVHAAMPEVYPRVCGGTDSVTV